MLLSQNVGNASAWDNRRLRQRNYNIAQVDLCILPDLKHYQQDEAIVPRLVEYAAKLELVQCKTRARALLTRTYSVEDEMHA